MLPTNDANSADKNGQQLDTMAQKMTEHLSNSNTDATFANLEQSLYQRTVQQMHSTLDTSALVHHHHSFLHHQIGQSSPRSCGSASDADSNHENHNLVVPMLDIHRGNPIRVQVKVLVPVSDHPNYNFIGKLLGPKGNSLKWLQEQTQTKMAILGRGSMRDKLKEEELRRSNDPKHWHLREELHVEITAFADAATAYQRLGHAMREVQRFLVPDYYDEIRQQQLRELGILTPDKRSATGVALAQAQKQAQATLTATTGTTTGATIVDVQAALSAAAAAVTGAPPPPAPPTSVAGCAQSALAAVRAHPGLTTAANLTGLSGLVAAVGAAGHQMPTVVHHQHSLPAVCKQHQQVLEQPPVELVHYDHICCRAANQVELATKMASIRKVAQYRDRPYHQPRSLR